MSITDELREFMDGADGYELWCPRHKQELLAIADRIDAEHQKAIRELNNLADASVLLPVDADGVPIRIGDVMDFTKNVRGLTVFGIGIVDASESSLGVFVREGHDYIWYNAEFLHHHTPTVEDVLREFTDEVLEWAGKSGTVAEVGTWSDVAAKYAKRFRLAEGED